MKGETTPETHNQLTLSRVFPSAFGLGRAQPHAGEPVPEQRAPGKCSVPRPGCGPVTGKDRARCQSGGAPALRPGAIAQSPSREAALAWASLAQRFPASSVLAREGAGCGCCCRQVASVVSDSVRPHGL